MLFLLMNDVGTLSSSSWFSHQHGVSLVLLQQLTSVYARWRALIIEEKSAI